MRPHFQRRRGVSLIEMVVAMGLISAILAITSGSLYLLMRAEGTGAKSVSGTMIRSHLARDFRHDVHAARQAQVNNDEADAPQLRLVQPDGAVIQYAPTPEGITRTERRDKTIQRTELYRLSSHAVRFAVTDRIASLTLSLPATTLRPETVPKDDAATQRPVRIEAVIARDLRFQSEGE